MNDLTKRWYLCPKCGKKLVSHDHDAQCKGVYAYCRESGCRCEYEIKIGCAPDEPKIQ